MPAAGRGAAHSSLPVFESRRHQRFWTGLRDLLPAWDARIEEFNQRTGLAVAG